MTDLQDTPAAEVIVAGHICLDVIPEVNAGAANLRPGILVEAGSTVFSTGGAVANTGLALHRLGIKVRLAGKIGDDIFGQGVLNILRGYNPDLTESMVVSSDESTSYSIIISPPGTDRMFIHSPGANASFVSVDVSNIVLSGCRLLHFGYPPLMQAMSAGGGKELQDLFKRARSLGLATSLDLSMPDMSGPSGQVHWPDFLRGILPLTDVFLPSFDELLVMLGPEIPFHLKHKLNKEDRISQDLVAWLADWSINAGAAIVAIKTGSQGLYARTAGIDRVGNINGIRLNKIADWTDQQAWAPCFVTTVVGTTGSGDATIAGFLMALIKEMTFDEALQAACAVGACSVEASDAVSGIKSWPETRERIQSGWPQLPNIG